MAAAGGHVRVLQWLFEKGYAKNEDLIAKAAASKAQVPVLVWLYRQSYGVTQWGTTALVAAAERGHQDTLQWLHAHGVPWSAAACSAAAQRGQLETLKWLREQGCPWDSVTCRAAAAHLETLTWAVENGAEFDHVACATAAAADTHLQTLQYVMSAANSWTEEDLLQVSIEAANNGNLEVLQWLHAEQWLDVRCLASCAVVEGNIALLEWAHKIGAPPCDALEDAADCERLDILKWLHAHDCPPDEDIFALAVARNNLELLNWLLECGCPRGGKILSTVASHANLNTLKWLREKGIVQGCLLCQPELPQFIRIDKELSLEFICAEHHEMARWLHKTWNTFTFTSWRPRAIDEGNLYALRYVFKKDDRLLLRAIYGGHLHILQWLYEQKMSLESPLYCEIAAATGQLALLKWLREHGAPWDERTCYEAVSEGHLDVLVWAVANKAPFKWNEYHDRAVDLEVRDWLESLRRE